MVAADTFTAAQFGCTVRFINGAADTEVTGTNSVLGDLLQSTLVQPAMIYHDVIPLQDVIERVLGNVRLYEATRAEPTVLLRDERLRGGRAMWRNSTGIQWLYGGSEQVGRPTCYYLEPVGMSQGGEPEFLLRVAPLPASDYTVRLEAQIGPRLVTFEQLGTAATVSVPASRVETILIPLCEAALTTSNYWQDKGAANALLSKADGIRNARMGMMAHDIAPSRNRMGTPCGY